MPVIAGATSHGLTPHGIAVSDCPWHGSASFVAPKAARKGLTTFLEASPAHGSLAVHAAEPHRVAVDFLFGGAVGQARSVPRRSARSALVSLLAEPVQVKASGSKKAKLLQGVETRLAMMGLLGPPGVADKGAQQDDEPEKGWCKYVPRGLTMFATLDALGVLLLAATRNQICDFPLRPWILGGILLGFPASYMVHKVAASKPAYAIYKFTALQLRGGSDPTEMMIDGLALYRFGGAPVESGMSQEPDEYSGGKSILVKLDHPEVVASYRVISSHGDAARDPIAWKLEGSNDGLRWDPVDSAEEPNFPTARGQQSALLEDLLHLENDSSFRKAYWLEVGLTAAAFGWLMAGTSWVSASSEACIDSAPLLWIPSFVNIVFSWSAFGTMTVGLIVSAVAMVAIGAKAA
mmetsp:Transcript_40862/g.73814  ORF Transcript_40862/g.73814 Transcript_40862/m.73814 type:complete len:406 (+) Transcript_40862:85-1302(+)